MYMYDINMYACEHILLSVESELRVIIEHFIPRDFYCISLKEAVEHTNRKSIDEGRDSCPRATAKIIHDVIVDSSISFSFK